MAIAGSIFKHDYNTGIGNGIGIDNGLSNKDISNTIHHDSIHTSTSLKTIQSKINDDDNDDNNELKIQKRRKKVYHVAIMPCHDKKLEAERRDLAWEKTPAEGELDLDLEPDVDLVITTNELLTVLMDAAMAMANKEKIMIKEDGTDVVPIVDLDEEKKRLKVVKSYFQSLPSESKIGTKSDIHSGQRLILDKSTSSNPSDDMDSSTPTTTLSSSSSSSTMKGSGSYADFIFRFASSALFGHVIPSDEALPWKSKSASASVSANSGRGDRTGVDRSRGNNGTSSQGVGVVNRRVRSRRATRTRGGGERGHTDSSEVSLYRHPDGSYSCHQSVDADLDADQDQGKRDEVVLKFATTYGFKNIQLVFQRSRNHVDVDGETKMSRWRGGSGYDFMEVMACPSGCLNGGGQISNTGHAKREKPSDIRSRVERSKQYIPDLTPELELSSCAGDVVAPLPVFNNWRSDSSMDADVSFLRTRFHNVPKLELSTGATAGVAVDDTQW